MARGYPQVEPNDYLYRADSRLYEREYRVLYMVFDGDEAVKVAVAEVRSGTVANPGPYPGEPTRFWSLKQIDQDAKPPVRGYFHQGMNPVTDADGRKVKSPCFDRMIRTARQRHAEQAARRGATVFSIAKRPGVGERVEFQNLDYTVRDFAPAQDEATGEAWDLAVLEPVGGSVALVNPQTGKRELRSTVFVDMRTGSVDWAS